MNIYTQYQPFQALQKDQGTFILSYVFITPSISCLSIVPLTEERLLHLYNPDIVCIFRAREIVRKIDWFLLIRKTVVIHSERLLPLVNRK